jgi:hypothetical protein
MPVCEVCGNDYDKAFEVRIEGATHVFDSFECAIQALAPTCAHCGCRVIGHGVEEGDRIFCCVHCASQEGVAELRDRAWQRVSSRLARPVTRTGSGHPDVGLVG